MYLWGKYNSIHGSPVKRVGVSQVKKRMNVSMSKGIEVGGTWDP